MVTNQATKLPILAYYIDTLVSAVRTGGCLWYPNPEGTPYSDDIRLVALV
jgi:hypothetical protein